MTRVGVWLMAISVEVLERTGTNVAESTRLVQCHLCSNCMQRIDGARVGAPHSTDRHVDPVAMTMVSVSQAIAGSTARARARPMCTVHSGISRGSSNTARPAA